MLEGNSPRKRRATAIRALALSLAVVAFFGFAFAATAQQPIGQTDFGVQYGAYTGLSSQDPRILVAKIIRLALGLLGTIVLLLILYAGFLWMTSAGDASKIEKAKKILTQAIIGLIIIVSSFAITSFIISKLQEAVDGSGGVNSTGSGVDSTACIGLSATCPSGALGSGIIDSHYPPRNAANIARNTRIVVTFKEAIDPASVVIGGTGPTVAIIRSDAVTPNASGGFPARYAAAVPAGDLTVVASADNRTFTIVQSNCSGATPDGCIGSPSESVFYTVALQGGSSGVRRLAGAAAFTGIFSNGYAWEFQVSTVLDVTPPRVTGAFPTPASTGNPRNSLVHLDFSEAMDPISLQQIAVSSGGAAVQGSVLIGAAYASAEFRSDQPCGVNACGETIYCLPSNASISVAARACGLSANPPTGVFPPNGLTDMAGNSLDGDADGTAEGPSTDDYDLAFTTGNEIDLTPPRITAQEPAALTGEVARDLRVSATFSKLMSSASFSTSNARLVPGTGGAPINYWVTIGNVSSSTGGALDQSQAVVSHDMFGVNQPYSAAFTSGLRDVQQNCFYPSGGQGSCTGGEPFCCNGSPTANEAEWRAACGVTP